MDMLRQREWTFLCAILVVSGGASCGSSSGGEKTDVVATGGTGGDSGGLGGAAVCPTGQDQCTDGCRSLASDHDNCGTCGNVCNVEEVCTNGTCWCRDGLTTCGSTCQNLASDAKNCGFCGFECPDGRVCTDNVCTTSCRDGETDCSGSCFNLKTDGLNCGECAHACSDGNVCVDGACACPAGQESCSGLCVTLSLDASNCGSCGHACGAGETCSSGACLGGGVGGSGSGGAGAGGRSAAGGAPTTSGGSTSNGGAVGTGGAAPDCSVADNGGAVGQGGSGGDAPKICTAPATGDVSFSMPSGTFQGSLCVGMTAATAGAEIRYTLDGTEPTATSTLYSAPVSVTATTRIRAKSFVGGGVAGEEGGALYVASSITPSHDVPVLILDNYGAGALSTTVRDFVNVAVVGFTPEGGTTNLTGIPSVVSYAAFHVRGQSSAMMPKIPYRLELRKSNDGDRNCQMFGMPAESDWALVGPYPDKSLVRNAFVYGLGRDMGMQAPRLAMVELYVNTDGDALKEDDYQGVYQVVETIKNQADRLNLQQLKPEEISGDAVTGGYIFKTEWMAAEEPLVPCPSGDDAADGWTYIELVDPDPPAAEQLAYLTDRLVGMNDAFHSATPSDPTTGYPAFIDEASFVDQIIIQEFGRNMDGYVRSQYFYKDVDSKNPKIFAGPLWDYDLIAGVGVSYMYSNMEPEGFQFEANESRMTSNWFTTLAEDPAFRTKLRTRWAALRTAELSDQGIRDRAAAVSAGLANAAARNFTKWPILPDATVMMFETSTAETWQGQIDAMVDWLILRAAWLDTAW